jgi:CRISPR-associated protein Cas1
MGACAERDVSVSFLSERGRFLARVCGPVSGNVLLRREQYRRADSLEGTLEIARAIVLCKLANARRVLLRAMRDHTESECADLRCAADSLRRCVDSALASPNLDALRGIEGEGAALYFGVFGKLILSEEEDFLFSGRNRRPPLDPVNCLLSFIYTLLMHDVRSALESVGLDPCVGFLHRDRPGRAGLALDLMEEFRAPFADRLVLSLINRKQLRGKDFQRTEQGAVLLKDAARKEVLVAYQNRKQEEMQHPFLKESMTLGRAFHIQALLLARHLRGDLDGYPAFVWR